MLQRHLKYGPGNVSLSPGGPLNGLRVRLHDKLARLNNAIDNDATVDFDDDSFRDCFIDLVGYGLIGLLVVDGDWPSGEKPEKPLKDLVDREQVARVLAKPRSYRWSELCETSDWPTGPDGWPDGTTFKADNGEYLWTRRDEGWRGGFPGGGIYSSYPSLRTVVESYHYTDGTITEPSNIPDTLQKEAA